MLFVFIGVHYDSYIRWSVCCLSVTRRVSLDTLYILICSPDVKPEVLWSSRIVTLLCLDASYDLDFP